MFEPDLFFYHPSFKILKNKSYTTVEESTYLQLKIKLGNLDIYQTEMNKHMQVIIEVFLEQVLAQDELGVNFFSVADPTLQLLGQDERD